MADSKRGRSEPDGIKKVESDRYFNAEGIEGDPISLSGNLY